MFQIVLPEKIYFMKTDDRDCFVIFNLHDYPRRQLFVSNFGRVKLKWKLNQNERLKKQIVLQGYLRAAWHDAGSNRIEYVHRLVAMLFVANPQQYDYVDHIDGSRSNNCSYNLRWVKDAKANANNPIRLGKKINKTPVVQIDVETGDEIMTWENAYTAAKTLGFANSSSILSCC